MNESFFDIAGGRRGRSRLELLTVARLTERAARKNIEGVLGAIDQLRRQMAIHYTIVGDGDDKERLMTVSRRMGLADHVTFAGAVSHDELKRLYSDSDLFVMVPKPSARDVEGFGIVYIEASAAGVPVLASRSDGCLEVVTEGENGWLVEDSTPEGIAASGESSHSTLGSGDERPRPPPRGAFSVVTRHGTHHIDPGGRSRSVKRSVTRQLRRYCGLE